MYIQNLNIKNLNTLTMQMPTLHTAKDVNLKVIQNNVDLTSHKGIWNVSTDKLANVVGKSYKIIQHKDVVQSIVESLGNLNLDVKGEMQQTDNRLSLDLLFQDQNGLTVDDKDKGIMTGFRAVNSYDKTSSFRLEMYAFRLACQNGMILGTALNNIREITVHVGENKTAEYIRTKVTKFIKSMVNSSQSLQNYVNGCMADSLEYELAVKVLGNMVKTKKHFKAISKIMAKKPQFTRWDLYNAITDYATHSDQLSPNVKDWLQNRAQKILVTASAELPAD